MRERGTGADAGNRGEQGPVSNHRSSRPARVPGFAIPAAFVAALWIGAASQGGGPTVPGPVDPATSRPRTLLDEAKADRDPAAKRAKVAEAVEALLSQGHGAVSPSDIPLLAELGRFAQEVGDLDVAIQARQKVLDVQSQILPDDDRELQRARQGLAAAMRARGELQGALSLYTKVVDVFSRTLPPDHRDLQRARGNLAASLLSVGDFSGARSLLQEVLEVHLGDGPAPLGAFGTTPEESPGAADPTPRQSGAATDRPPQGTIRGGRPQGGSSCESQPGCKLGPLLEWSQRTVQTCVGGPKTGEQFAPG